MRKVKYAKSKLSALPGGAQKHYKTEPDYIEKTGHFHQWGTDGDGQTCGIVEDEKTGEIVMIDPANITFLDHPEDKGSDEK